MDTLEKLKASLTPEALTLEALESRSGPELVELHNDVADALGEKPVKRFADKSSAVRRTQAIIEKWESQPKVQPTTGKQQRQQEEQPKPARRGTNVQPNGKPLEPCLIGSKQAALLDQLARPEGATMADLLKALEGGRKPWQEQTVRAGFSWDLKNKGYGVRSSFGPDGTERFFLVVPEGQAIPAHVTRGELMQLRGTKT